MSNGKHIVCKRNGNGRLFVTHNPKCNTGKIHLGALMMPKEAVGKRYTMVVEVEEVKDV